MRRKLASSFRIPKNKIGDNDALFSLFALNVRRVCVSVVLACLLKHELNIIHFQNRQLA